jgi:hypothetical protein
MTNRRKISMRARMFRTMDDETFKALGWILDDYLRSESPVGSGGSIEEMEEFNRAYQLVDAWFQAQES